jgi:opacity protein-like surface antigen
MVMSGLLILLTAGELWAGQKKGDVPSTGFYLSIIPTAQFPFSVETTSPGLSPAETRTKWGVGIGGSLAGYYDLWGATMNLFYDIPVGFRFRPYVGAGLGVVFFEAHDITLAGFPPTTGRNKLFTYKLMAGVSCSLSDAWRLLLGYRFMGMNGPDFETGGVPLQGDPVQTHAVQAGVQFYF